MQKLKNENILALKYAKNNANLPHFKTISVNDDVKSIIIDLLDTNHVNEQFFNKLSPIDKRLIRRFVKTTKMGGSVSGLPCCSSSSNTGSDDDFTKRFSILRAEYNAGNDSQLLKTELRQYTLQALQEGSISNRDAMMLMFQLSL